MKCLCCGNNKEGEAIYPYEDDSLTREIPIPQLLTIECQGSEGYKMAIMCHDCWHRLETTVGIDMWIGENCWQSLNPLTPFANLPEVKTVDGKTQWNPYAYGN